MGATVVDRSAVITTHLAEIARRLSPDLLSRQDVKQLVDLVREHDPAVIDDLTATGVGLGEIQRVLQSLLAEQVPVRDLTRILEVISERSRVTRDPEAMVEAVRVAMAATICAACAPTGRMPVVTFDPVTEQRLIESVTRTEAGSQLSIDPETAQRLATSVIGTVRRVEDGGEDPVVVCAPGLRVALRSFLARLVPHVRVMSYDELADHVTIDDKGMVNLDQTAAI
jgi:flagellar biosynthesis protein FlhA